MEEEKLEQKLINKAHNDNIFRLVVGGVIIKEKRKVLLLKRKIDDFLGGIDELPSGKVEEEELLIATLKREILEETGLPIKKVIDYLGHFDYISKTGKLTRQFNFAVTILDGKIKINPKEHEAYYWVDIDKLSDTKLTQNVIEIISSYKF